MISNPGSSISPTTMVTSIYDTGNKKQDIFQYTDSKVSDKVTSAQVASQISSATSNFATKSELNTKLNSNDPYLWTTVQLVPWSNTDGGYQTLNSITSSTSSYIDTELSTPLDFSKYMYQFIVVMLGMGVYSTYTSASIIFSIVCLADTTTSDNYTILELTSPVGAPFSQNTHTTNQASALCVTTFQTSALSRTTNFGIGYINGSDTTIRNSGIYSSQRGWYVNKPRCSKFRISLSNTHRHVYESCGISVSYRAYRPR